MWTPEETNLHYGHAETCIFGKENSGMCNCGRGFDDAPNKGFAVIFSCNYCDFKGSGPEVTKHLLRKH